MHVCCVLCACLCACIYAHELCVHVYLCMSACVFVCVSSLAHNDSATAMCPPMLWVLAYTHPKCCVPGSDTESTGTQGLVAQMVGN